jgi:hypothetical protein
MKTEPQSRRAFLRGLLLALPVALAPRAVRGAVVKNWSKPADLDFIANEIPVISRARWNPIRPEIRHLNPAVRYHRLTIHHAGTEVNYHQESAQVLQDLHTIALAHHARRYGDIGYHFIVDYGGRIWEGRSLAYEGAHVSGANQANIGIMLLGNFERQRPSLAQLASMEQLTNLLQEHFGIRSSRVYGHCDLGATLCPGQRLYPFVKELRRGPGSSA